MNARDLEVRPFEDSDGPMVMELWHRCGLVVPWNDPHKDVRRKLTVQRELFLVGTVGDVLVAAVMAGYDGHRGSVNYLAVDPEWRRHGVGRRMMDAVETALRALGCPKINLMVRTGNLDVIAFYEQLGFKQDDVLCLGKRLEDDVRKDEGAG